MTPVLCVTSVVNVAAVALMYVASATVVNSAVIAVASIAAVVVFYLFCFG